MFLDIIQFIVPSFDINNLHFLDDLTYFVAFLPAMWFVIYCNMCINNTQFLYNIYYILLYMF